MLGLYIESMISVRCFHQHEPPTSSSEVQAQFHETFKIPLMQLISLMDFERYTPCISEGREVQKTLTPDNMLRFL